MTWYLSKKCPLGMLEVLRYFKYWYKIFNPRQLLLIIRLTEFIRDYRFEKEIEKKELEYIKAITLYLSFILAKHANYNCRLTSWHRLNQQISSALSTRGINIMWDHTEVNPFIKTSWFDYWNAERYKRIFEIFY